MKVQVPGTGFQVCREHVGAAQRAQSWLLENHQRSEQTVKPTTHAREVCRCERAPRPVGPIKGGGGCGGRGEEGGRVNMEMSLPAPALGAGCQRRKAQSDASRPWAAAQRVMPNHGRACQGTPCRAMPNRAAATGPA
jgi:hypothetical protein